MKPEEMSAAQTKAHGAIGDVKASLSAVGVECQVELLEFTGAHSFVNPAVSTSVDRNIALT